MMNRLMKVENLNISNRERKMRRTLRWAIIATLSWVIPLTTEYTETIVFENPPVEIALVEEQAEESAELTIEEKIRRVFPEAPDVMLAIAKAESGLDPNATNVNKNGSSDIGIFQINSVHGYDDLSLFDPDTNIEAARKVYEKQGLTAWTVFKTGVYKKFL